MVRTPILAASVAASLLLAACGGVVEDLDPAGEVTGQQETEDLAEEPQDAAPAGDQEPTDLDDPAEEADEAGAGPAADAEGPQPDPELVAAPCADHLDREMDLFIELASPVQDQLVGDTVELVGCANVFEATVSYLVLDGDGRTLDEGFTTATCGNGCVGEFRHTVDLTAGAGEPVVYLQVYSQNMADEGPEQLALTEVMVVLG